MQNYGHRNEKLKKKIDAFHRKMLNIRWPTKMSKEKTKNSAKTIDQLHSRRTTSMAGTRNSPPRKFSR